jgi:hypothetical protein
MNMSFETNGFYSPYSPVGAISALSVNPYMAAIPPVTLEQYRNRQDFTTSLMANQVDFMGKINPLFSTSRDTRLGMTKSLFARQADFSSNFSPYSVGNLAYSNRNLGNYAMNRGAYALGNSFSMLA